MNINSLIESVGVRPELYSEWYRVSSIDCEDVWRAVAKESGRGSGDEAKDEWKKFRHSYRAKYNKNKVDHRVAFLDTEFLYVKKRAEDTLPDGAPPPHAEIASRGANVLLPSGVLMHVDKCELEPNAAASSSRKRARDPSPIASSSQSAEPHKKKKTFDIDEVKAILTGLSAEITSALTTAATTLSNSITAAFDRVIKNSDVTEQSKKD